MQKLNLTQSQVQKLSPQQIQFIKLLQIPTVELENRVDEELEINPALERAEEEWSSQSTPNAKEETFSENSDALPKAEKEFESEKKESYDDEYDLPEESFVDKSIDIDAYLQDEEYSGYKMYGDGRLSEEEDRDIPIATSNSLQEYLISQLGFLPLSETEYAIGLHLIGSLEEDGYIRRALQSIVNDLAFIRGLYLELEEVEKVLLKIQTFDPPGIGARNLQECLLIQLKRIPHSTLVQKAIEVIANHFDEFSKKHYEKIQAKLNLSPEEIKNIIKVITKINPKPGSSENQSVVQYLMPDFILHNNNGKLELSLNGRNTPELRISKSFGDLLDTYSKSTKKNKTIRETVSFVKQKLDSARWFIDAIKQRQSTLLRTMQAILIYQEEFFFTGDETKLKPMILKDIATIIEMDISTISRVANSKCVQTEFGLYPLKYFFSEGIATDNGEDASSREVKNILRDIIVSESKKYPLSDDKLEKLLNQKGYNIARRTVAKYREQMNIPVARLRKQL